MHLPPAAAGSIGTGKVPQPGPPHYITAVRGPVNRRVGLFRRWQPGGLASNGQCHAGTLKLSLLWCPADWGESSEMTSL